MTREEAIKICTREKEQIQQALDVCADGDNYVSPDGMITALDYVEAMGMAISALREQEHKSYNTHEVACIISELFGDNCACDFNNIDEWLPEKCELLAACPNTVGVACWEQYLKHRCGRRLEET